jgi:hypothetical protein
MNENLSTRIRNFTSDIEFWANLKVICLTKVQFPENLMEHILHNYFVFVFCWLAQTLVRTIPFGKWLQKKLKILLAEFELEQCAEARRKIGKKRNLAITKFADSKSLQPDTNPEKSKKKMIFSRAGPDADKTRGQKKSTENSISWKK